MSIELPHVFRAGALPPLTAMRSMDARGPGSDQRTAYPDDRSGHLPLRRGNDIRDASNDRTEAKAGFQAQAQTKAATKEAQVLGPGQELREAGSSATTGLVPLHGLDGLAKRSMDMQSWERRLRSDE